MKVEISPDKLKDYAVSSKACTFQKDGAKLGPRFGRLILCLAELNATKCDLHFKRVSGNGKTTIKSEETINVMVASKVSQVVSIPIKDEIEVRRASDSTGEIILSGLTVYTAEKVMSNWREIIKRCGKYKCLRMVKGQLFASSGGFIEDNNAIKQITTNPSGMFAREGNRIKFLGSCEITNIQMEGGQPISVSSPYVHREGPTPNISTPAKEPINAIKIVNVPSQSPFRLPAQQYEGQSQINSSVVFSSSALSAFAKFSHSKNKFIRSIRSNNKSYLLVRKGGRCSLSISEMQDSTEYIIVIKAKKLNGNGKLLLALAAKENDYSNMAEVVFGGNINNKYVTLKTKTCKYGQFHKLNIAMGDNSSGEILIEEVLVVDNIGISRTRGLVEHGFYHSVRLGNAPPSLSFGFSLNSDDDIYDPVYQSVKRYARYIPADTQEKINTISGSVATTTISGMSWLNKIKPIFPKLRLVKDTSAVDDKTLMVGRMGSLLPAKRIWVDAFFDKEIIENDMAVLRDAKHIYSPSSLNLQMLKSEFPNAKVELCARPLPYIKPRPVPYFANNEFALCFHRGNESTHKIIRSWQPHFPKIALVGSRGLFPETVIPVNEYMPYENLLYLVDKCKFIIDIPTYSNYDSALLDIAHHMGVPIVSSNWFVLDKDDCIFLPPVESVGVFKVPTTEAIRDGVTEAYNMSRGENNIDKYKAKFIAESIKLLVGT